MNAYASVVAILNVILVQLYLRVFGVYCGGAQLGAVVPRIYHIEVIKRSYERIGVLLLHASYLKMVEGGIYDVFEHSVSLSYLIAGGNDLGVRWLYFYVDDKTEGLCKLINLVKRGYLYAFARAVVKMIAKVHCAQLGKRVFGNTALGI